MKTWKKNVFRLIVFGFVLLAIPFAALHAAAAEEESAFPEEGKYYCICGTWKWNGISREGSLSVTPGTFWEEGKTTLTGVGYSGGEIRDEDKLSVKFSFSFEKTEDGYYKILPASMPNGCLQLGTNFRGDPDLAVGIYEGRPEQKWSITPLESGKYHIFNAAYPDAALGAIGHLLYPTINGENSIISFYFVESAIEFPETRIYVKAPAQWYPGIWVHPLEDDVEYSWLREATMEIGSSGWYSYASPSGSMCKIANHATKGVGAQTYEHDDIFDLEGIDFSTDKWVVITDDSNVEGDLTYQVYDYNPDDPPPEEDPLPKEGVLYTLSCTDSKNQIVSLEFPIFNAIHIDTLTCGPLTPIANYKNAVMDLNCAFSFKEVQNGYYTIIPATAPDVCLQVNMESPYKTINGSKFDNKPEQLWTITPSEGGIRISNAAFPDLILGLRDGISAGSTLVAMITAEWVFALEESQVVFPEQQIHVKAPDFWAPCSAFGNLLVFMPKGDDGWYSYYHNGNYIDMENLAISSSMAQVSPPDFRLSLQVENPDQDYWIVITDDPNVDGDLTYQVYDYNPDEPPKTADPVTLALPVFTLLTSAFSLSFLLRRRKTV